MHVIRNVGIGISMVYIYIYIYIKMNILLLLFHRALGLWDMIGCSRKNQNRGDGGGG